jgi:hypothetical protein
VKAKKRKAPVYDVNEPGISKQELEEQDEIYNIQLAGVKKRMEEVEEEGRKGVFSAHHADTQVRAAFETLQVELALHRKEMKRVRDEVWPSTPFPLQWC